MLHQCHLLISTMVHFITQLQYYITFEVHNTIHCVYVCVCVRERYSCLFQVMECCWARLVKKVEVAEDLDQVIDAHDSFLEQITTQCLLDPDSQVNSEYMYLYIDVSHNTPYHFHLSLQPILTRLRAIFDLVIMFQHKQSSMLTECFMEVERRAAARDKINKHTKEVGQYC